MKSHPQNTGAFNYTGLTVLNMFIMASVMFLVVYYVIVSNIITASSYKIGLLNEELFNLTESNGLLTAQKLVTENSSVVLDFARGHNMVEAGRVTHLFENDGVALQR